MARDDRRAQENHSLVSMRLYSLCFDPNFRALCSEVVKEKGKKGGREKPGDVERG